MDTKDKRCLDAFTESFKSVYKGKVPETSFDPVPVAKKKYMQYGGYTYLGLDPLIESSLVISAKELGAAAARYCWRLTRRLPFWRWKMCLLENYGRLTEKGVRPVSFEARRVEILKIRLVIKRGGLAETADQLNQLAAIGWKAWAVKAKDVTKNTIGVAGTFDPLDQQQTIRWRIKE